MLAIKEKIKENIETCTLDMSKFTTFKVGGVAENVFVPSSAEEVSELVRCFKEKNSDFFVLGNGSNVVMPDGRIETPIILIGKKMADIEILGDSVAAGAGALLSEFVCAAHRAGLIGMEFAAGIPGSVGGAAYMNAGAFDGEMKDIVEWIEVVCPNGDIEVIRPDCNFFAYRFSGAQVGGRIITKVGFKLKSGTKEEVESSKERMDYILARRKLLQPLEYPSAGSVFKRPEGYFAGKLIDEAGLKGFRIGGAMVSEKHAGFFINVGGATSKDVNELVKAVADVVYKKDGVRLEPEIMLAKIK